MSPRPGHGPESAGPLYPAAEVQTGASLGGVRPDTTAETLANLGLPPDRQEGQQGFLVYETDGRLPERVVAGSDGHMIAA